MIKSEPGLGSIYQGSTQLAWTGSFEQTGESQITLHGGLLTLVDGTEVVISDEVYDLVDDGGYKIEYGYMFGQPPEVALIAGWDPAWRSTVVLAGYSAGIVVEDGVIVDDVYVLSVIPGEAPEVP
jgi:hypothetical protein